MVAIPTTLVSFLLVGSALAAPRWWQYQGPGDPAKHEVSASASASAAHVAQQANVVAAAADGGYTPPPGGVVSNGILYLTTTITLQPGQSPPTVNPSPQTPTPASSLVVEPVAPLPPAQTTLTTTTSPPAVPAAPAATTPLEAAPSPPAANVPASSSAPPPATEGNSGGVLTKDMILSVDGSTASCASEFSQCATADQAAPALNKAFATYKISNKGAQAAVLALELYESVSFKYDVNLQQAAQGTRAMFMPNFVAEYATAVVGADKVAAAGSQPAVLALVNANDELSFGSGAWFLATKCPDVLSQFASSPDAAWTAYLGPNCISTTATPERQAVFDKAKAAFGI